MYWTLYGLFFVIPVIVFAVFGLYLVRKTSYSKLFVDHHDVAGFTFGIIGVVYAVLLGFIVVTVQERFNQAHQSSEMEGNTLSELYRDAAVFSPDKKAEIRGLIREYVNSVLADEWDKMSTLTISDQTVDIVKKIWTAYAQIEPKDQRESIWLQESLSKLNEFSAQRLQRLYHGYESLGGMMWMLLIMGAIITIGFIYLFYVKNFLYHALMTGLLAGLIAFMLFLVGELDRAYDGSYRVNPIALQKVKQLIDRL